MSGSVKGGKQGAAKILARDPDFFKKIGAKGGRNGSGYGFAHGKVDPSKAGTLGGKAKKHKSKVI